MVLVVSKKREQESGDCHAGFSGGCMGVYRSNHGRSFIVWFMRLWTPKLDLVKSPKIAPGESWA